MPVAEGTLMPALAENRSMGQGKEQMNRVGKEKRQLRASVEMHGRL